MVCLKCGFKGQEQFGVCPKCGAVQAKVARVAQEQRQAARQFSNERRLSDRVELGMEQEAEIRNRLAFDLEMDMERDSRAYPFTLLLSQVFYFLAALVAITDLFGLFYFYRWGRVLCSTQEMVFSMVALVVASAGSVLVLLAIGEGLKMGRDVANHNRAIRDYLWRMLTERAG